MKKKIIIVGGVAGGATAAARLRRLNEEDTIIMFERGEYISFANCGLPYYIGGVISERKKLLVQTVEGMSNRFNLDIRNLTEVVRINAQEKMVTARNLQTGEEYVESYDALILSPGSKPIKPQISGIEEAKALFTVRNVPDTDRIKQYVDEEKPKHAVVIGGGFIGLELAENLVERGVKVTVIERGDQVMAPIDFEMAQIVHAELKNKGINLILNDGVKEFKDQGTTIILESGGKVESADMIILAIGVQPETQLAKDAGLELGVRGTIKVNEKLQTSDPSIYAVGDAIEVKDYINGTAGFVPLAGPANRQGRIVADVINGMPAAYKGVLGTSIVKVFELTAAVTGNNEKTLRKMNRSYEVIHVQPMNHAGYYPGASPMTLKVIFDKKTGGILGAQAVGKGGIDKRIDVLATAIKASMTVEDLADLELSYAPPYSSAKDPVNIAGYAASNIVDGSAENVQWHEIDALLAGGGILIDVRDPGEVARGAIDGAINIPVNELRERLGEVPRDKDLYVSCQVGLRGYLAARILTGHGMKVKNLDGGYKLYSTAKSEY
ncbi:CoA-disulfide reductase [Peribacillus psychrosaccharolyticus]|uniref:CoA-disulfide reductase n=1 Tax=Peribacillus psychrosaccharolyticus TaxID=1407 RepID=A0A974NKF2_PERPY|nr:CoA-disulfide reductase [Peribacillus psychrosaccharolyticus]MEC2055689.1 CoA-disulfide reductase [Peribacillus psychrosaccharolyticus]MED3743284.1 CoA-disulfide reductase [Peribacillus psychrosaccharolyticus]QQS99346.1 CoA-disulfide reductase [Peribacillus psychrosaccharolyticus]